jgi:hypothetical protein
VELYIDPKKRAEKSSYSSAGLVVASWVFIWLKEPEVTILEMAQF